MGKEDFEAGVYGRALQQVLQCLPYYKGLGYLDIQERSGLSGRGLDYAPAHLEKLSYIKTKSLESECTI